LLESGYIVTTKPMTHNFANASSIVSFGLGCHNSPVVGAGPGSEPADRAEPAVARAGWWEARADAAASVGRNPRGARLGEERTSVRSGGVGSRTAAAGRGCAAAAGSSGACPAGLASAAALRSAATSGGQDGPVRRPRSRNKRS
jgi:hypothetical protein